MHKARRQCMDLQSLRDPGVSSLPHPTTFATRIGGIKYCCIAGSTGLAPICIFGIAGMIVTAGQSQAGNSGKQRGETRQLRRACNLEGAHRDYPPKRWRFAKAMETKAVSTRTTTTSPENIRPVGTTAV